MPMSEYVRILRSAMGHQRLLLPSVSALVYDNFGHLLLVRQRDGDAWSTPGGAIEFDETPADAVVRETWEETGLLVSAARIFGVYGGPNFVVHYENGDPGRRSSKRRRGDHGCPFLGRGRKSKFGALAQNDVSDLPWTHGGRAFRTADLVAATPIVSKRRR